MFTANLHLKLQSSTETVCLWIPSIRFLPLISCLPDFHNYLNRGHPWTQTPADIWRRPTVVKRRGSLCGSGSCGAPVASRWLCMSGSSEKPSCGTAVGRSCGRERPETCDSRMSNSHSWADVPDQRTICHPPAGGAPVGRSTWSCQQCWRTGGHRAAEAAHTHLCLPAAQKKKTSTGRGQQDREMYTKDGRKQGVTGKNRKKIKCG